MMKFHTHSNRIEMDTQRYLCSKKQASSSASNVRKKFERSRQALRDEIETTSKKRRRRKKYENELRAMIFIAFKCIIY